MTTKITATAADTLNRVAAEIGSPVVPDPYSTTEQIFKQMAYLLNTCGEELCQLYPWEFLTKEYTLTTKATDSGTYELPQDFLYKLNQTGWDRANQVPLVGPLSPQDWQYLEGRDLVSSTIYASYRIQGGKLEVFPQPPPAGSELAFEYVSSDWVQDSTSSNKKPLIETGADRPLFNATLLSRMLKVKILDAKGFDTAGAQQDLNQLFGLVTERDKGAQVLRVGGGPRRYPYLHHGTSLPDTGYGG